MGDQPRAKLFMHGRSQAVRLPKEFRLPGTEVEVHRDGDSVVLTPIGKPRVDPAAVFAAMEAIGPLKDFMSGDRYEGLLPPRDISFD